VLDEHGQAVLKRFVVHDFERRFRKSTRSASRRWTPRKLASLPQSHRISKTDSGDTKRSRRVGRLKLLRREVGATLSATISAILPPNAAIEPAFIV
jgi:hypothetical protein